MYFKQPINESLHYRKNLPWLTSTLLRTAPN
jgi:hypothetical protein